MTDKTKNRIAGTAGGLVNGAFGGGGGMVLLMSYSLLGEAAHEGMGLLPLLTKWSGLEAKNAFATCVAIILPMCCVSTAVYLFRVRPEVGQVLPYLAGGVVGGVISGLTFEKVPVRILKLLFGAFLLYAGVRYLLW